MDILDSSDVQVGKAVRHQLRIFERLLCLRIRFQKTLAEANKLPAPSDWIILEDLPKELEISDSNISSGSEKCFNSLRLLTNSLLDLQDLMFTKYPETKQILSQKHRIAADDNDSSKKTAYGNEEITSSEDEKEVENIETNIGNSDQGGGSDGTNDSEESGEEQEELDEQHIPAGRKRKRLRKCRKPNFDYTAEINKRFKLLIPFRNETIEKWNTKTEVASGKFKNSSAFSSFRVSALKQIEQVMSDKERLIRRTQLKRSEYTIIGESENNDVEKMEQEIEGDEGKNVSKKDNYNEEIFDDEDFYHQLLREIIERKTSNINDPTELNSSRWIELQKIRSKNKRKVDTKSSKGRKVRYAVHPKLVNFMAPHDECPTTENAYNEILNSLFANAN